MVLQKFKLSCNIGIKFKNSKLKYKCSMKFPFIELINNNIWCTFCHNVGLNELYIISNPFKTPLLFCSFFPSLSHSLNVTSETKK